MIHRGQIETISLSRLGEADLFVRIPGPLEWADLPQAGADATLLTGENASAQFPAILGKGDRFTDASSGVIWEVLSVDHGVLWVRADVPQPDQEVTMPPITDTRYTVTSLAFFPGGTEVEVVAREDDRLADLWRLGAELPVQVPARDGAADRRGHHHVLG